LDLVGRVQTLAPVAGWPDESAKLARFGPIA